MQAEAWCDGSGGSPRGSSCACVIVDIETGEIFEKAKFLGKGRGSNNVAEYEGVILLIETALDLGVTSLSIFTDSQLIANQIMENWDCKDANLRKLRSKVISLSEPFEDVSIEWTPRENNKRADLLCRQILDQESPRTIPLPKPNNPFRNAVVR